MSEPEIAARSGPGSPSDRTDRETMDRLASGDLGALERLYEHYGAMSFSIAYRITGDRAAAEDVVQEAFLGAWRNAYGRHEVDEAFTFLKRSFSDCTSFTFELQACDVVGDMAYTAGLEHISNSFDGQPRSFTLRATQVYRREGGEWKVAHRHADFLTE